jgi:hypothetical protein
MIIPAIQTTDANESTAIRAPHERKENYFRTPSSVY